MKMINVHLLNLFISFQFDNFFLEKSIHIYMEMN